MSVMNLTRHSIRVRLTAWYTALTFVALVVTAVAVMALVRHSVTRAADDRLAAHHAGLERFANGLETNLSPVEVREEYREYADVSLGNALFELVGSDGQPLARPDVVGWVDATAPLCAPTLGHGPATADLMIGGQPYRASTRALTVRGAPAQAVIAVPMGQADAALARAEDTLLWWLPFVTLVAAGFGYLVSGRALRPVDRLTLAAQQINVENLHQRLDVPPAPDELQRLAVTFNGMLDRLETGVSNISRFTSEASHELRTPVALVRTTAELALRRERTPAEYTRALSDIHALSRDMSDLVDDLLTLARADAGVEAKADTIVDINDVATDVVAHVHGPVPALEAATEPLRVQGAARQIQRLLAILIENAVKYSAADRVPRLRLRADGTDAVIDVEDDGMGVAAEDVPRVFERFYRGANARAGAADGSGLGLAIARVIVERHGGTIGITSPIHTGADPGTRVTVRWPRVDMSETR